MPYNSFCQSSYLAFRYVARPDEAWTAGIAPEYPDVKPSDMTVVRSASDILAFLRNKIAQRVDDKTGILLSGGIDSGILAALLPKGLKAYTIRFVAPDAVDEAPRAKVYADYCALDHKVVEVHWQDHVDTMDDLMIRKKAPLHAIEVALHKTARQAAGDGVTTLLVGNGADSTFGGMDKLLSKDWTFDEFVQRYTFIDPASALRDPVSIREIYEPYRQNGGVNVQGFLKRVHGLGIIQSFENAIHGAGCAVIAPYEGMALGAPLDISRVRAGEPKYLLQSVFAEVYRDLKSIEKIPFARPMTQWLADWSGPRRSEFLPNLDMANFSGDQKWLLYSLERFLGLLDSNAWGVRA